MSQRLTPAQLRAKAASYLRSQGHSLGEIADAFGLSKTQVARMTAETHQQDLAVGEALDAWLGALEKGRQ